jgi:murein tripeptide amidase MpaA
MWIAVELLESEDPVVRALVQDLQFIILPLANPDGYLHTWTQGGRQWRKSRSPQPGTDCLGAWWITITIIHSQR